MSKTVSGQGQSGFSRHLKRGLVEGMVIALIAFSLYLLLALISFDSRDPGWTFVGNVDAVRNAAGRAGAFSADLLLGLFGYMAYLFPVLVGFWAGKVLRERHAGLPGSWPLFSLRLVGFILTMLAGTALSYMHFTVGESLPEGAGGILGHQVGAASLAGFNPLGGTLIMVALFLIGVTIFTDLSWIALAEGLGALVLGAIEKVPAWWLARKRQREEQRQKKDAHEKRAKVISEAKKKAESRTPPKIAKPAKPVEKSARVQQEKQQKLFTTEVTGELPPIALLDPVEESKGGYSDDALEGMSRLLEIKLKDFNIDAQVVAVQPGPVITRFEIQPAPGIKVSKITNLAKDLARSLAVISVRVVEVIPGKTTVGIEIPNEQREMIRFTEVVGTQMFDQAPSPLTMALGKDISGGPVMADLAKMPHLLVAGTTGSGKSVGVNAMLLSMLFKSSPDDVRLILIDPKMLELAVYDGIPHLLTPVVTDMKEAAGALRWGVGEMERRYRLMASMGVRNISGYNRKVEEAKKKGEPLKDPLWKPDDPMNLDEEAPLAEHLPYIVIVIDEFADMMMIVGKKVEELIARIAQKARAAGIHLILATQRPSVDVITGLIKANVPSRIGFQVSSKIDSRTVLDQGGAEQLLGHGDMLYLPGGTSVPERVHGAFVSDEEVHRVCDDWRKRGKPNYLEEILEGGSDLNAPMPGMESAGEGSDDENDPLYDDAVAIVTESRRASISSVQRKLKIGYNRAARLVEAMEMAGVVTEAGNNGQREVIAPPPVK
ncbi:MAG: cell division protein FtsK [Alcanivorax borkumensis]|uniref:DNA translocase FtsK n=2 Tax=Alcanivorax TaxID=59753 RepID=Q0VQ10_ALCBS|nr:MULTISPECIES: DNA translocase FtsK [Alcanivorax]OJH07773.1 MAG: cell division protein FtsK [Alcanivorax borkumensis]EUC71272.1 cell division protein FtsK [Alcanivorax sp. 97CO-5]PKG02703.1 DNA translocase FtsK [Alcanivorax sp. 97CO-6]CAL16738.1 cell division protein FtsK [Alcanivorax borkumensis SK2]BAP14213.1 DNA translocase FtsK [Alcanivorax sp. NBRC 101098]